MNNVVTVLLEFYLQLLTVLLECIGIPCKLSEPDWFLKPCKTPRTAPGSG